VRRDNASEETARVQRQCKSIGCNYGPETWVKESAREQPSHAASPAQFSTAHISGSNLQPRSRTACHIRSQTVTRTACHIRSQTTKTLQPFPGVDFLCKLVGRVTKSHDLNRHRGCSGGGVKVRVCAIQPTQPHPTQCTHVQAVALTQHCAYTHQCVFTYQRVYTYTHGHTHTSAHLFLCGLFFSRLWNMAM